MHMADALLSPEVALGFWAVSAAAVAHAARVVEHELEERSVPLMGVLGAFVFGAQMVNFAIPGTGSSGHLVGGVLLAAVLGPWAALLTMTCVLVVQCLLFADGGLLALGANIFNMAICPCLLGGALLEVAGGRERAGRRYTAALVAVSLLCTELGALGVAAETVMSARSHIPFRHFAAIMMVIHLPIGVAEGAITASVLRLLARLEGAQPLPRTTAAAKLLPARRRFALGRVGALACAFMVVGTVAVWFASLRPDGLAWALGRAGGGKASLGSPTGGAGWTAAALYIQRRLAVFSGYTLPGARKTSPGTGGGGRWPAPDTARSAAGLAGGLATVLLVVAVATLVVSARKRREGKLRQGTR